jgi:hypothetical protein
VVAQLAFGLKIITPLGTVAENALEVMVEQLKLIVAPEEGIPFALIWALNQMVFEVHPCLNGEPKVLAEWT